MEFTVIRCVVVRFAVPQTANIVPYLFSSNAVDDIDLAVVKEIATF
jgi:hypothetical protein